MRSGAIHRSLDGHRYRITGDLDLSQPFTSVARYAVDGRLVELSSGDQRAADGWARDLGIERFDDEFTVAGGRLRTARVTSRDTHSGVTDRMVAATWQGRRFSMFVPLYNSTPSDAVNLFRLIRITEHDDGLSLDTANPRRAGLAEPADVAKEVPDLGLLEITALNRATARRLPSWTGARVSGGELFRDRLDDSGTYFVLATRSAMVTVLPHDETGPPRGIDGLHVEAVH